MKTIIKYILLIIIISILIFSFNHFKIYSGAKEKILLALQWVHSLGPLGPIAFFIIYIFATILFFSGALLTMASGALFGVVKGAILVSFGSIIGASCAFLLSRYSLRRFLFKKIKDNQKFISLDNAVAKDGWKIIGLTRLSPVLPSVLLNYSFGLTKVPFGHFVLASWLGMIPGITMFSYIGSVLGNLAAVEACQRTKSSGEWIFYIIGLTATVIVTVYVTKMATDALKTKIKL